MKKILLLGVGGNVSQGILKSLRESDLKVYIVGACVSEYSSGLYLCDESYISPYACSGSFIPWVIDICNRLDIDMIMTGVEENILCLTKNIYEIRKNTKAIFVSSNYNQLVIGQNKFTTCEWLRKNDCNYPQYCKLSEVNSCKILVKESGFPLIAKPNQGKSSEGIKIIKNEEDLESLLGLEDYVLQEYLPSETGEFTVGCYINKAGELQDLILMERKLSQGKTVYAKIIHNKDIETEAKKIVYKFNPVGPFNIQMRLNRIGNPVCFEFNVRFSGSTAMRATFGFKDVKAMIKEYLYDEHIDDCFSLIDGECFRYDNEFYLFNDQVNKMKECGKFNITNQPKIDNTLSGFSIIK